MRSWFPQLHERVLTLSMGGTPLVDRNVTKSNGSLVTSLWETRRPYEEKVPGSSFRWPEEAT